MLVFSDEEHNPKNVAKVTGLMEEYEGREEQLLLAIMTKYGLMDKVDKDEL